MVNKIAAFCIRRRVGVVALISFLTVVLSCFALRVDVKPVFNDLLPQNNPYVQINDKFKETFGGSNMVSLMVEVDEGDIFRPDVLETVRNITVDLNEVKGVNHFQIVSLASKKIKELLV